MDDPYDLLHADYPEAEICEGCGVEIRQEPGDLCEVCGTEIP